jgi:hypothetical protein
VLLVTVGSSSGSLLANKIPGISCLISLDGSEFHHYGEAKEEDKDFDNIRQSVEFRNMKLAIPYLRLESTQPGKNEVKDSVYNFSEKLSGDIAIFKVDSAQHEDFGCLSKIVRVSGNCYGGQYFKTISKLALSFLQEHLTGKASFSEAIGEEINKTVRKK